MSADRPFTGLPPEAIALLETLVAEDAGRAAQLRAVAAACATIRRTGGPLTVARVAAEAASTAPSARTMYNPEGASYRKLIKACAAGYTSAGERRGRSERRPAASIAERMPPSPLRAEVRTLEADHRTLRLSYAALQSAQPAIHATAQRPAAAPRFQLTPLQRHALTTCLDAAFLRAQDWHIREDGSIAQGRTRVFPPGFCDAIRCALEHAG